MDMEKYTPEQHALISHQVRIQLGDRLERLLRDLEPLVSGQMGEPPMPGHLQAYLSAIKMFGDLYQVAKPPRPDGDVVEASKVDKLVEAARMKAVADTTAQLQAQKEITSTAQLNAAAEKLRKALGGSAVDQVQG